MQFRIYAREADFDDCKDGFKAAPWRMINVAGHRGARWLRVRRMLDRIASDGDCRKHQNRRMAAIVNAIGI